jgi:cation transport ATPase
MSKAPGMMSLITLGITVSYVYSVYAVAARYVTENMSWTSSLSLQRTFNHVIRTLD